MAPVGKWPRTGPTEREAKNFFPEDSRKEVHDDLALPVDLYCQMKTGFIINLDFSNDEDDTGFSPLPFCLLIMPDIDFLPGEGDEADTIKHFNRITYSPQNKG